MDIGTTPVWSAGEGYWGHVTSTVDWCEANYAKTPFIAEFYNTISSLTMVTQGLAGLYYHWRFGKHLSFAFFCVFVVGLGSMSFHGTLKHEYQLLDELPMIYAQLTTTYCLVEDQRERKYSRWFPIGLTLFGVLFSILLFFLASTSPFWTSELFRSTFLLHVVLIMLRIGYVYTKAKSTTVKRLFAFGITSYCIGFCLWLLDLNFCSTLEALPVNPQLHAIWHLSAGTGSYLLLLVVAYYRAERVYQIDPVVLWGCGFIPYIGGKPTKDKPDAIIETPTVRKSNGVHLHETSAMRRSPRLRNSSGGPVSQ